MLQRLPLSGISINVPLEASPRACKLPRKNDGETRSEIRFTPIRQGEAKEKLCPVDSNRGGNAPEYRSVLNGNFVEPVIAPHSNDLLTSVSLNDDFDESILEQIDAICKQIPCNYEREDTTKNMGKNPGEDVSVQTDSVCGKVLGPESCSTVDQACGGSQSCKLENTLTENMPEEYAKYIQSLNDRQKEAACSDTSIPLMIVAGPGSGKVSFPCPF